MTYNAYSEGTVILVELIQIIMYLRFQFGLIAYQVYALVSFVVLVIHIDHPTIRASKAKRPLRHIAVHKD